MIITPIARDILVWLLRLPFLRLDDLVPLVSVKRTAIKRHLTELIQAGYVATLDVGHAMPYRAGRCCTYYLTDLGITQSAQGTKTDPLALATAWGCNDAGLIRLLARMPDLLNVQIFLRRLADGAPQGLDKHAGGQWCWVREYTHQFSDATQHARRVRADAAFSIQIQHDRQGTLTTGGFLLLDPILDDWDRVRHHLAAFLAWRDAAERWRQYRHFPPLLLLARDERHIERWAQCNRESAERMQTAPLVIAAQVWHAGDDPWHHPWWHLVSQARMRLGQILTDMPVSALPPDMMGRIVPPSTGVSAPPTTSIVIGNFAQRAARQHLPTQRHAALLSWQLASTAHLTLHYLAMWPRIPVADLALLRACEQSTVESDLRKLAKRGCVILDLVSGVGTCARLSPWGAQVVSQRCGQAHGSPVLRTAIAAPRFDTRHDAGVYHFCAQVVKAARDEDRTTTLWWETAAQCSVRYQLMDRWYNLRPDAQGLLRVGYRRIRWWLEWDTGTMDVADFRMKFGAYARFVQSRQWQANGGKVIPTLLCVAPHYAQFERLRRVATEILPSPLPPPFDAFITLAERLEHSGPFGPIWGRLCDDQPLRLQVFAEPELRDAR